MDTKKTREDAYAAWGRDELSLEWADFIDKICGYIDDIERVNNKLEAENAELRKFVATEPVWIDIP